MSDLSAITIAELDPTLPKGTDLISQGNEHLQTIKRVLRNSLPSTWELPGGHFHTSNFKVIDEVLFTPASTDSVLFVELTAEVKGWSTKGRQDVDLQLKDNTNNNYIGPEVRALYFQFDDGTHDRIQIHSYVSMQALVTAHSGDPFKIAVSGKSLHWKEAEGDGAGLINIVINVTER